MLNKKIMESAAVLALLIVVGLIPKKKSKCCG